MDLSMVFYYLLEDMPFHHATILIHNSHLTMWQITKEELFRQALENTPRASACNDPQNAGCCAGK